MRFDASYFAHDVPPLNDNPSSRGDGGKTLREQGDAVGTKATKIMYIIIKADWKKIKGHLVYI